jgi:hypothetical protein
MSRYEICYGASRAVSQAALMLCVDLAVFFVERTLRAAASRNGKDMCKIGSACSEN